MEALTYTFGGESQVGYVALSLLERPKVTEATWQRLADHIAQEESLSHYQFQTLANRWLEGRAAIALYKGDIVSYISLIPIFAEVAREKLSQIADVSLALMPTLEMYESATGWTAPVWRHRGLSLQLRGHLMGRFERPQRLFISATIGLGASYVLPKLGWQLASWRRLPFATALMGMSIVGLEDKLQIKARQPAHLLAYHGEPTSPMENPGHDWAKYCHFWVADIDLAEKLNEQLSNWLVGDVQRWREIVATILYEKPPEPTWKPFLFQEKF